MPKKISLDKSLLEYKLSKERKTFKQIAKDLNISAGVVKKNALQYKLDTHPCFWKKRKRRDYLIKNISQSWLQKQYQNKNRTANDIAEELSNKLDHKVYAATIINLCIKYGIKLKNFSESSIISFPKKRKTLYERMGVYHQSQSQNVKNKKINKSLAKYGTRNVFQSEEVKIKSKDSLFRRYGVYNAGQLSWNIPSNGQRSKIHIKVERYLKSIDVDFVSEARSKFLRFNKALGRIYSPIPDIFSEGKKFVIEIYGDYFHANPVKYKENDLFKLWGGNKTSKEIWAKDSIRRLHIESFGYRFLTIWESEINNNCYQDKINKFINEDR